MYEPIEKELPKGLSITKTLDSTSHFENSSEDVMKIYKKMRGKELDLTIPEME